MGCRRVTPVRILEGSESFTFIPHGPIRGRHEAGRGARVKETPVARKGGRWRVKVANSQPGKAIVRVHVGEHLFDDAAGADAEAQLFRVHGYPVSLVSVGTVYGIAGRTVDTRHILILIEGGGTEESAAKLVEDLLGEVRPSASMFTGSRWSAEHGTIQVFDPAGQLVASGPDALAFDVEGGVTVEKVEHSCSWASRITDDRGPDPYSRRFFCGG